MDANSVSPAPSFGRFLLQTGTAGPETDDTYEFTMADWDGDGRPDLVAIRKRRTGAGRTEVHILSGAGEFNQFLLQTGTALPETDDTYDFALADWDGDGRPDLVAIKKSGTETGTTEVSVLSGASEFKEFLLQTGTAGPETDDTYEFTMADWDGDGRPDLVAIRKRRTGAGRTEVHILSGAGEFNQFLLQTGTALPETDDTYDFALADWDGDGRPDLVAIKKSGTDTGTTEVSVLSGASEFKEFLLQTPTALPETDDTYDFAMADWDGDGRLNLVAIKKRGTDTGTTEVHVLGAGE